MGFLHMLRRWFRKERPDDDTPYSIVMLLRSPFALSAELLEGAASKAYGVPYDGSNAMYFVGWTPSLKAVKAGEFFISIIEASEPYFDDPVEVAKGLKDKDLANAWSEHDRWIAFDLRNRETPKRQAYKVLARLISELLDTRCAGIYLPKDNQFTIEGDGSAREHLRRLGK